MSITARDVVHVRAGLQLGTAQMAAAFGVSVSTVYRWEATAGALDIDPIPRELLEALGRADLIALRALGGRIRVALTMPTVGNLVALRILIEGALAWRAERRIESAILGKDGSAEADEGNAQSVRGRAGQTCPDCRKPGSCCGHG